MGEEQIDFEGTAQNGNTITTGNGTQQTTDNNGGSNGDTVDVNNGKNDDINNNNNNSGGSTDNNNNNNTENQNNKGEDDKNNDKNNTTSSSTGELAPGTQLEIDGETYTIAENGDVVDKDNKVIKPAAEVKDWLASFEESEDNSIDMNAIQDTIGVEITDENGNPIEYENNPEGLKSYVNAVVELKSKELQEGAVNKLFADNPILKQFNDYVQVTGTYRGFGELPDRSGVEVDKDNEVQQENIINIYADEVKAKTGMAPFDTNYVKYLKDSGALYDTAVKCLNSLKENDAKLREQLALQAEENRKQEAKELTEYLNRVNDVINSRTIAGYKIPESFVKEVNGQKQTLTPKDFYNYLTRQTELTADGNRITAYQKDLAEESAEDLLNRELLSAWLTYTGATYKDLADMAIKEDEVRTLKLRSKSRSSKRTVKLVTPSNDKVDDNEILFS